MGLLYMSRGEIRNQSQAGQLFCFKDLKMNKITPSDIDGLIEYKNKCYIFFEFKYNHTPLPTGQRLMFERLIDDLSNIKPCIFFLASWDESILNEKNEVVSKLSEVYKIRHKKQWITPDGSPTLKACIDWFIESI